MKPSSSLLIIFFAASLLLPAFGRADETAEPPAAHFLETSYIFSPVVSGTYVTHDYVVQNKGSGTLNIQKVQTG
jgi:hypothetical protein